MSSLSFDVSIPAVVLICVIFVDPALLNEPTFRQPWGPMKVLTRSRYERVSYYSGWARSDRQRPVAEAVRGRAFLSEYTNDNRSCYYKGGQSEACPPCAVRFTRWASAEALPHRAGHFLGRTRWLYPSYKNK